MTNIKVGDNVIAGYRDYCVVRRVVAINPNTISVEGLNGGCREPRQHPYSWRVAVPEIVKKVKALFEESERLLKEAHQLICTMPKVEL